MSEREPIHRPEESNDLFLDYTMEGGRPLSGEERLTVKQARLDWTQLMGSAKLMEYYGSFADIGKALRGKYGNAEAEKYLMLHVLGGSTPRPERCNAIDFPGDDSIARTLRGLAEREAGS